jgi:hypothetical protein
VPAPPLIPGVYEVTTFGTLFGKACDHVLHYQVLASPGQELAACHSLANQDVLHWLPTFSSVIANSYEHVSTRAVYLGDTAVPEATANAVLFGSDTTARLPAFACATIRHTSPKRGKGLDGRTNIPSVPVVAMTQADCYSITTTNSTQYTALWAQYQSSLLTGVQADLSLTTAPLLVIAHRKLGTFSVPVSSTCDPYLNTHRRWVKRLARHRRSS